MATFGPASDHYQKRLLVRLSRLFDTSPEMASALFAIGQVIANNAKMRATRELAVDTGRYRARIAPRIERSSGLMRVVVGPFGIKYARMIEYGGVMTRRQMRAMFAAMRDRGKRKRPGKGIIVNGYYHSRPIMGRALDESRPRITEILRKLTGQ